MLEPYERCEARLMWIAAKAISRMISVERN